MIKTPDRWLLWWLGGAVAAVGIGWAAARLHLAGFAPIGIVSLGVGMMVGGALAAIAASQRLVGQKPLVVGTIVLSVLAVLAEHAWLYVDFRRQWHMARANSAEVAMFRAEAPWPPGEYFARELTPQRCALWTLDAVLIIAAAVAVAIVVQRRQR
jgi:hypothetical protein